MQKIREISKKEDWGRGVLVVGVTLAVTLMVMAWAVVFGL
jgi:hypothetical protein